jgi:hypothetical protein
MKKKTAKPKPRTKSKPHAKGCRRPSFCSAFHDGALIFAGLLVRCFDEPFLASQVLREMGFTKLDCRHLDEFDKESLRKLNLENGMRLRGLRKKPNGNL